MTRSFIGLIADIKGGKGWNNNIYNKNSNQMKTIEDDDNIEVMQFDFFDQKDREIANEALELELLSICYQICNNDTGECIDFYDEGGLYWCSDESSSITFKSIEDAKHFIIDNDLENLVYIQTYFMYDYDIFLDDFESLEPEIRICKIDNIINS